MDVLLVLVICMMFSYVLSYFFKRAGLPHILGHMLTGLLLSITDIRLILFQDSNVLLTFSTLSNLGLLFLLFFIGLKIDFQHLKKFSQKSINISLLSALIPFFFGFIFSIILGLGVMVSVVVGACLSVTAEAVSASILRGQGLMNSATGKVIIEAGVMDDIFEILMLAVLGGMVGNSGEFISGLDGILGLFFQILLFVGIIYIVRFFFIPFTFRLLDRNPDRSDLFTASFIIVLTMAAVANFLNIGIVIGALVAGVVVKQTLLREHKRKEENEVADMVETVTFGFLEPVFFLWIAYQARIFENIRSSGDFLILAVGLTILATLGKIIGSVSGALIARGKQTAIDSFREGMAIGWGMNARGAVELITAKIAFDYGLFSGEVYSAIFFMTFVTTMISPFVFKWMLKWYMDNKEPAAA